MNQGITRQRALVICVQNVDYPASLEVRKIYERLPDAVAAAHGLIRVADESGDDYLYPEAYFMPVELPQAVRAVLKLVA